MPRFGEEQVRIPGSRGDRGASAAGSLAQRLSNFSGTMFQQHKQERVSAAKKEAAANTNKDKLELVDNDTLYGRTYDEVATDIYLRSSELENIKALDELARKNKGNPAGFKKSAEARRIEYMNSMPEQVRPYAALAYDKKVYTHQKSIDAAHRAAVAAHAKLVYNEQMAIMKDNLISSMDENNPDDVLATLEQYDARADTGPGSSLEREKRKIEFRHELEQELYKRDFDRIMAAEGSVAAMEYAKQVREGKVKMVFDSGLTNEAAADYLEKKTVESVTNMKKIMEKDLIMEDHQLAIEKQQYRDTHDEGMELWRNGELTDEWIDAKSELMSENDFDTFKKVVHTGEVFGAEDAKRDDGLYLDLMKQASMGDGFDAVERADAAVRRGTLTTTDYDQIKSANFNRVFKTADTAIHSVLDNQLTSSKAERAVNANAIAEWEMWKMENAGNPDITLEDARKKKDQIIDSARIIRDEQIAVFKRLPLHAVGNRKSLDIAKTRSKTIAEFMVELGVTDRAELLNNPAYVRELALIEEWELYLASKHKPGQ